MSAKGKTVSTFLRLQIWFIVIIFVATACNLQTAGTASNQTNTVIEGPPVVEISSPSPNATYRQNTPVTIMARIGNAGPDIARVLVELDGTMIGEAGSEDLSDATSFSITQSWTATALGQHTFTITAFREDGTASNAATVTVNVIPEPSSGNPPAASPDTDSQDDTSQTQNTPPTLPPQNQQNPEATEEDTGQSEPPPPQPPPINNTIDLGAEFTFSNVKIGYPETGWIILENDGLGSLSGPNTNAVIIPPDQLETISPGVGSNLAQAIEAVFNDQFGDNGLSFDSNNLSDITLADGRSAQRYDFLDSFGDEAVIIAVPFSDGTVGVLSAASFGGALDDIDTLLQVAATFDATD